MNSVIQIIIKFSPLVLFIMLIFINREEKLQVIGFLGLELFVVWGAFKLNYRAARHRETIHTTTEELMVESQTPAGKRAKKSFPIGWLRVSLSPSESPVMSSRDQQKIILSSHGEHTEIGKYLHPAEKAGLSRELGSMIDRARATRDAG